MKILLINLRHIGDALLITPLINNLKQHFANPQIDVLINDECASIFESNQDINRVLKYERKKYKKFNIFKRIFFEINFSLSVRGYDIVICTTEGERSAFLAYLSGAKVRVGIRPPKGIFANTIKPYTTQYSHAQLLRHTLERNLDALRAIDVPIVTKKVVCCYADSDLQYVLDMLGDVQNNFIQIHAVSRWMFKCLPNTTVAQVIDFFATKYSVVLTGAPSDIGHNQEIIKLCKSKPLDLSGKLTLPQMAALSSKAKLFFGVDSAPMHIAASQNIPCVAVFGPSGAFNWGPWDNDEFECGYINKNGLQFMGKHTVVQTNMDCAPCGKAGCNNTKISDCLVHMQASEIENILRKFL